MKKILLVILLIPISIIGIGLYSKLQSNNIRKEIVTDQIELQANWKSIDENIQSFNRLANVITEKYSELTHDPSLYMDVTNTSSKYKDTLEKGMKYALYKNNREVIVQINNELKTSKGNLTSDKFLTFEMSKELKLIATIKEQVKLNNKLAKEYNTKIINKFYVFLNENRPSKSTILN